MRGTPGLQQLRMARSPARPESAAPELAILTNPAALHALKRAQLLVLCKQHGVKGSGKVRRTELNVYMAPR